MDFNRATEGETNEAITNILSRGGTEDWKLLYARAMGDGRFRAEVRRRLRVVDIEASPGAPGLWAALLDGMDAAAADHPRPGQSMRR